MSDYRDSWQAQCMENSKMLKQAEARIVEIEAHGKELTIRLRQAEAEVEKWKWMMEWCYDYVEVDVNRPSFEDWLLELESRWAERETK